MAQFQQLRNTSPSRSSSSGLAPSSPQSNMTSISTQFVLNPPTMNTQVMSSFWDFIKADDEYTDITFRLHVEEGSRHIKAHRIILAAWSDYFKKLFSNGMKESKEQVIEIESDISPLAFARVLQFCYGQPVYIQIPSSYLLAVSSRPGSVSPSKHIVVSKSRSSLSPTTTDSKASSSKLMEDSREKAEVASPSVELERFITEIHSLLEASTKFLIQPMVDKIEEALVRFTNYNNFFYHFAIADQFELKALELACSSYFVSSFPLLLHKIERTLQKRNLPSSHYATSLQSTETNPSSSSETNQQQQQGDYAWELMLLDASHIAKLFSYVDTMDESYFSLLKFLLLWIELQALHGTEKGSADEKPTSQFPSELAVKLDFLSLEQLSELYGLVQKFLGTEQKQANREKYEKILDRFFQTSWRDSFLRSFCDKTNKKSSTGAIPSLPRRYSTSKRQF